MLVRKPARFVERNRPTDRLGGTTTMKPTHLRLDAAVSCSIASAILVPNRSDAVQVYEPGGRLPASSVAAGDGRARIATLDLVRRVIF
jgi:hypothetical protein